MCDRGRQSSIVVEQVQYGERLFILAVLPKGGDAAQNPECATPAPLGSVMAG